MESTLQRKGRPPSITCPALNSFAIGTGPHACRTRTMKSATEVESWASLVAGLIRCSERTTSTHISGICFGFKNGIVSCV